MIGYQELTMNEPQNSRRSSRLQFQVICGITVAVLAHTLLTSGALKRVDIQEGSFPGGEYIYKFTNRDYAASMSLSRSIVEDLDMDPDKDWKDDWVYTVHLDHPLRVGGRHQRFASGILINKKKNNDNKQSWKKTLLKKNDKIETPLLNLEQQHETDVHDLWPRLQYQSTSLPKVPAAIITFPFSNGVASALIHTYKIFPKLHEYATEHGEKGNVPVVITTCSLEHEMCTHYAPLAKSSKFRFGNPDTEVYMKDLKTKEEGFDWSRVARNLQKQLPSFMRTSK